VKLLLFGVFQVPGQQVFRLGERRPRPRSHRPRTEHRHGAFPRRHGVHREVFDVRLPVYGDARWETVELPGDITARDIVTLLQKETFLWLKRRISQVSLRFCVFTDGLLWNSRDRLLYAVWDVHAGHE